MVRRQIKRVLTAAPKTADGERPIAMVLFVHVSFRRSAEGRSRCLEEEKD
jgi:hypothetical protein